MYLKRMNSRVYVEEALWEHHRREQEMYVCQNVQAGTSLISSRGFGVCQTPLNLAQVASVTYMNCVKLSIGS